MELGELVGDPLRPVRLKWNRERGVDLPTVAAGFS
jgi:hypothetical protein